MRSGDLDQVIELQSLTETNVNGELVKTYVMVEIVHAKVISQRGSESFEAARMNARETIRLQLRYRDDVQTSWRLIWQGQSYNIIYVDHSSRRNGGLWITAELSRA